jgi:hypothetical protein
MSLSRIWRSDSSAEMLTAFWNMMPCRLVHRYQSIGGACLLHLQGSPRRANIDAYTPIYTVSYPARLIPSNYHLMICPPQWRISVRSMAHDWLIFDSSPWIFRLWEEREVSLVWKIGGGEATTHVFVKKSLNSIFLSKTSIPRTQLLCIPTDNWDETGRNFYWEKKKTDAIFEVLTAVTVEIQVFWDMTPCALVHKQPTFRWSMLPPSSKYLQWPCCPCLQGSLVRVLWRVHSWNTPKTEAANSSETAVSI